MEIEQKETDCKCENSTGWTTIKCCNQCGKSIEPFWRVDSENKTQPTIGIKEKEVDRTLRDEIFDLKSEWEVCQSCNGDIRGICTDCYNTRRIPNQSQIQYQKEQITKLEAEIKALRELMSEVRRTFGNDTMVVQILPEKDSYYTPTWLKKIDQLLKNEG